ncbi:trypsin-like peptidase domain-containing protein [Balneolales bacterium ANBcel1]|nr:trypsin-like peptidase domain-containing protein [Balneolales bacterium ANBcel1]
MPLHQKVLTALLLLLTGMLLGVLLMVSRGSWIPLERVEVRYTDVKRSMDPVEPVPGEEIHSPAYIFNDIARDVLPAVVYIETDIAMDQAVPDDEHHQFEEQFWERFLPRRRAQSIGSGVLISPDGYILTNHHVVDGAGDRVRVMTHDKKQHRARLVGGDASTDLAVLKIETENAPSMVVGNSDNIRVGDWVMAVGNPFRLRSTVTAGIVSALGRDVDIISDRMRIESFIQTDAAINRGNSGGALVNTRGELIGINTAIASESGTYQGYGFAVPVNMAMKIARDIIEFGEVQRAFLGVEIASVDYEGARSAGLDMVSGVEIRGVANGGSADLGGVKRGDIVLQVNGFDVDEANHLQERIALMRPGEEVNIRIWREGRTHDLEFPVMGLEQQAIRDWAAAEPRATGDLDFDRDRESAIPRLQLDAGFTLADLPDPENLSRNQLVVIGVEENSRAYRAGLREEDIVLELNGREAADTGTFSALWDDRRRNTSAELLILRSGEQHTVTISAQ